MTQALEPKTPETVRDTKTMRDTVLAIADAAKAAAAVLATAPDAQKRAALLAAADRLAARQDALIAANARDLDAATAAGATPAFIDRLRLTPDRIGAMAEGLRQIAAQPDPIGVVQDAWGRPNGLRIERVTVPLGVIGIIFESRPNVTADAGGLCLKSGNAAILRCGSESFHSASLIAQCLADGLGEAGLPAAAIQLIPTRDRDAVGVMLTLDSHIDVIIPRGGKGLIARVAEQSRIPVLKHLDGICHVYLHQDADPAIAEQVTLNAKMRRPGVCGAAETLLVDRTVAERLLPPVLDALARAGCALRGDAAVRALDGRVTPATEDDWDTEYLDAILSVKCVDGLEDAIGHINRHGSHHTESIITQDPAAAQRFFDGVQSGILLHNASTQFADGGEFGMGAEIGISTGKLHARGPVGAAQLTSYKYLVRGSGQTRPA